MPIQPVSLALMIAFSPSFGSIFRTSFQLQPTIFILNFAVFYEEEKKNLLLSCAHNNKLETFLLEKYSRS